MAKIDFDNLLKFLTVAVTFNASTTVSTEMDFELPRGFIAKIHEIEIEVIRIPEDFEGISVDKMMEYSVALIRDPDDITTLGPDTNRVDHDLLASLIVDLLIVAGTAGDPGIWISNTHQTQKFDDGVDVITARNMRVNVGAAGTDNADATEALGRVKVSYTLEEVDDVDILNLLDIL